MRGEIVSAGAYWIAVVAVVVETVRVSQQSIKLSLRSRVFLATRSETSSGAVSNGTLTYSSDITVKHIVRL